MRILLIDDSGSYFEEFSRLLADAAVPHSTLDVAKTALEGARKIATGDHDIYFVDYRLPGGDGVTLVRQARVGGTTKPIIMLTGFGTPFIDQAAEEAGATEYLVKGEFSPEVLNRTIRYAVRNARAVEAARAAETRFRLAQDVAGIGTWDWDIRANHKVWSPQMRMLYGLDPTDTSPVSYDTWRMGVHPDDRDKAQAALIEAVGGGAPYDVTFRVIRPNMEDAHAAPNIRWVAAKGDVFRDASGAPYRMIGINVDITEQHQALLALQQSRSDAVAELRSTEARFRTYFDSAPECLFHICRRPDGQFVYGTLNPAGLALTGKSIAEVCGHTPEEVLGPQADATVAALRQVYATAEPVAVELSYEFPSGQTILDAIYVPLRDEAGAVTGVLGSARNITERRRLEASLHQAQKMEAVGQLAGGVAHDFNNLLTGMQGCFELLGRQVKTDSGKRLVEQGVRAVQRGTALTSRLLAFSRQQPMATESVDLRASLNEMTEMLTRILGADVRVGMRTGADLWPASTDRNQIELAILNLAINARDAMPLGGSLTIETRNETVAESRDGLAAGDFVVVAVSDTGTGMPPEVLRRVLEPFFTTKPSGKGTGLGLSMVAGVVRQLGGGLTITSEVGRGTCVNLYLPRADAAAEEAQVGAAAARILLVDDDPNVQSIVPEYAAEAGHVVAIANSTAEAMLRLDAGEVDVLVVDHSLPGLGYQELISRARARRSDLPVLVISGRPDVSLPRDLPLLVKPFRYDAFRHEISRLLKETAGASNVVQFRADAAKSG